MNAVVNGLVITATGAAWAAICTLGLRSGWYIQQTAKSVLTSHRRPVTPEAIAQLVPWMKAVLIVCIVMGVAIAALGVVTLLMAVIAVLDGR
jgi:hypothetical protein